LRRLGRSEEAVLFVRRASAIAPNERAIQRLITFESDTGAGLHGPAVLLTGRVKRLLEPMGRTPFGFFTSDADGKDVYSSQRQIGPDVFSALSVGMLIEADVVTVPDGRRYARSLCVIGRS
jgi:cold shock CspA family protein